APKALLTASGNAQLGKASLVVAKLMVSGNGTAAVTADGATATTDGSTLAGQLLAGNLTVYVDNSNGLVTADEQARIQDAIDGLDQLLAPYSVTITEVPDPTTANVIIHVGLTSPAGTAAQGVLGCETDTADSTHDITILQGWNWYAGADPSAIGSDQYDF